MEREYEIKPIPTMYKGVTFKSRLEARWAVFFDYLGIVWFYEFEGFQLLSGWYVPDFWLPDLNCWIEIKPNEPSLEELKFCEELARYSQKRVFIQYGTIRNPEELGVPEQYSAQVYFPDFGSDICYWWCECEVCGKVGLQYEGRSERLCSCVTGDKGYNTNSPRLIQAYEHARRYSFYERGNNGSHN